MSHSYSSNRIDLVFSTKNREKQITEELQLKLWPYMAGIAKNHRSKAIKIGGVEDHAHVLLLLPATMPLAKAIQTLKSCSAKWMNDLRTTRDFAWQEGYGAFSVGSSQTEAVIGYIECQKEHHSTKTFDEEFISLLKRYGVKYDPEHVLG
jgi:putative transposase